MCMKTAVVFLPDSASDRLPDIAWPFYPDSQNSFRQERR